MAQGLNQMTSLEGKKSGRSYVDEKGMFHKKESQFRNWITADGSSGFKAEKGRYHLYVALACPWAHRVMIIRTLKGLEDIIGLTITDCYRDEKGWKFTDLPDRRLCEKDPINHKETLEEIYKIADPEYNTNVTVPVLWDCKQNTIVNNESSELLRMINSEFNQFCSTEEQKKMDFYPEHLREEIDKINAIVFSGLNGGVYKTGFSRTQKAYLKAVNEVFDVLDQMEVVLSKQRYLVGDQMTEADIRLFTTVFRFDLIYHGLFKCSKKRIVDYPNIFNWQKDMYQTPGIAETIDVEHIKISYEYNMVPLNPFRIMSIGPEYDYNLPHGREELSR